jgi:hypothetical protein
MYNAYLKFQVYVYRLRLCLGLLFIAFALPFFGWKSAAEILTHVARLVEASADLEDVTSKLGDKSS